MMNKYRSILLIITTLFLIISLLWVTNLYRSLDRNSFYAISGTQENYSWAVAKLTMSISDFKSIVIEEKQKTKPNISLLNENLNVLYSRIFVLSGKTKSTHYLRLQDGYTNSITKMGNFLSEIDYNINTSQHISNEVISKVTQLRSESTKIANYADHAETYQRTLSLNDFLHKRNKLQLLLIITWILAISMCICVYMYFKSINNSLEKQRQAVFSKNTFLAKVSHELRTSLQIITGTIDNLVLENKISGDQEIDRLNNATKKIIRQIKDLSDYVRIDNGVISISPSTFLLSDVINRAVSDCKTIYDYKNINLECIYENDYYIYSDKERLYQILENIISNAFKYTNEGMIKISYQIDKNNTLHIHIKDTGIGISRENINNIFSPFSRINNSGIKIPGTGMGLTIAKGITEAMGGHISVQSIINKGSLFTIEIPLSASPLPIEINKKSNKNKTWDILNKSCDILIIDDDNDILITIKNTIERLGHNCDIVSSPERAIQKLLRRPYDLIITDLQMPTLTGIDLIKKIRSTNNINSKTPFVIMTGYDCQNVDINVPVIFKPVLTHELETLINEHLKD